MKVLFLITKSNWGGAQRYVFDLATNLPPEHEAVVALGGHGTLTDKLDAADVRTISLSAMKNEASLFRVLTATKELVQLLQQEQPDVIHINSSLAGISGTLAARLARVPRIIFTAHGWAFNEDRSAAQRFALKIIHWLTILLSHTTITVSDTLQQQMSWPWTKRKMITVRLGHNTQESPLTQLEQRRALAATTSTRLPDTNDIWLGTIGELHPIKRQSVAIAAIAEVVKTHPNVRYILIGDGSERKALEQQVQNLHVEAHVFFLGHIHEASQYLGAFDAFLVPSKSEASGYVVLEAGQARLPIIASNVGGIPEWIINKQSGLLVPPDNEQAIAEAVTYLIAHPDIASEFAEQLHTYCSQWTTDTMVQATMMQYHLPQ